jgi:hypothetical protein
MMSNGHAPWSPDLIPCDFLCGIFEGQSVFDSPSEYMEDLRQKIIEQFTVICFERNGGHVE